MIKKHFFMVALTANLQGKAQVGFNLVTTTPSRNLGAAAINHMQDAGAQMVQGQYEFDDLVVQNIMYLGEMSDEEFLAGVPTNMSEAEIDVPTDIHQTEAGDVLKPRMELAVDNTAQNEHAQEDGTETMIETPVEDVTTVDVKTQD